ncbi:YraN family protein [Crocinitomix algicola]|uniref:YraN family protein n=1 Tax=Crocinitomix algicola TaxID=1740263 RepID=UPI000871C7A9|nr:YraN family protein [Crocinitomix algicola]
MAEHNKLGQKGEAIALDYLVNKGYQIKERNFRFKHQEVDIICEHENMLVVVEVKTRANRFMAGPEETVTKKKQRAIIKVTNHYVIEHEVDKEVRFDIVSILLTDELCEIDHMEDAFYPLL